MLYHVYEFNANKEVLHFHSFFSYEDALKYVRSHRWFYQIYQDGVLLYNDFSEEV